MKKTISFGKIDYEGTGRKNNLVTVELELKETRKGLEFSCCGNIWENRKTDILCGGQCLDEISKYIDTPLFKEIHRLWKKYHLNGMNAGTKKQQAYIEYGKENGELSEHADYSEVCEYLKQNNVYIDENGGVPYKYGSAWLFEEIPDNDLRKIIDIIGA